MEKPHGYRVAVIQNEQLGLAQSSIGLAHPQLPRFSEEMGMEAWKPWYYKSNSHQALRLSIEKAESLALCFENQAPLFTDAKGDTIKEQTN